LVFIRLELAAEALGGFPDIAGEVVELGFVERKGHDEVPLDRRFDRLRS
jgi:hypothetical protein